MYHDFTSAMRIKSWPFCFSLVLLAISTLIFETSFGLPILPLDSPITRERGEHIVNVAATASRFALAIQVLAASPLSMATKERKSISPRLAVTIGTLLAVDLVFLVATSLLNGPLFHYFIHRLKSS
jgi:hypothetical protein